MPIADTVQDELDAAIAQRRKLERERFDAQTVVRQTGEALAEQRRSTAKLLLGYRAVPYHGGRKKKKEAHCGDSVG
jgi:hypothetical protein